MSQDRFANAWVTVLAAAGGALALAAWAQSDLLNGTTSAATPASVAAVGSGSAAADPLAEEPAPAEYAYAASSVPSDPIAGSGGSGEGPAPGSAPGSAAGSGVGVGDGSDGSGAGFVPLAVAGAPEAAPAVAPANRVATDDAPCGFELRRKVLAREINENTPVEATSPLEANGRVVYLWFESSNTEGRSRTANFRWVHEPSNWVTGTTVELAISARWRTWAEVRPPATLVGPWRVEVIDDAGCQVDLIRFEMLPRGW